MGRGSLRAESSPWPNPFSPPLLWAGPPGSGTPLQPLFFLRTGGKVDSDLAARRCHTIRLGAGGLPPYASPPPLLKQLRARLRLWNPIFSSRRRSTPVPSLSHPYAMAAPLKLQLVDAAVLPEPR